MQVLAVLAQQLGLVGRPIEPTLPVQIDDISVGAVPDDCRERRTLLARQRFLVERSE
jgi:hypothetical protein